MSEMIRKMLLIAHFPYAVFFLHGFLYDINNAQETNVNDNDISYTGKIILLSPNYCFQIDEELYKLLCSFPMVMLYDSTVIEIARHETNEGNTSYHYFTQGIEPYVVPYYLKIDRIDENRYKGCATENFSLSLNTIPWESLTHITDEDGRVPIKKRHLQSVVKHLEIWMCTRISVNATNLQKLSFIDMLCIGKDVPNYDYYYPRLICPNNTFHCCSEECVLNEWRLDGVIDCFDGSDETECNGFQEIETTDSYLCDDGEQLVKLEDKCNEKFECQDMSDEDYCYGDKLHAPQLKELLTNYRQIMTTDFTEKTESSITHLTIYNSSKFDIYRKIDFKRLIRKISGFNNIKYLNLSYNSFSPPSNVTILFFAFLNVETLNLSHCEIDTIHIKLADAFPYLKILDLSHNKIKEIDPNLFFYMNELIYFNMSMSLAMTDITLVFDSKKTMKIVDLSNNKLENISLHFSNSVEEIDLSDNPLKYDTIDIQSSFAPAIDKLTLHGNKIDINMLFIERLEYVIRIDVDVYSLDCSDCRLLKSLVFSESLSSKMVVFNGTNNTPVCTLPEKYKGESVHKVNIYEFCPDPFIKTVISVSVISCLVIIISIIVGYKFQFQINYWIQYTNLKRRKLPSCDYNTDGYVYDAFISYCGADREWVWDVLCPGLEDCSQKYLLCLHDRDFPLGTHIFDNIEESFKKSKYCVMIISNCFIQSQWGRFELDAASMKLIQENREFLILIELEKLDTKDIPQPLEYLLRTRTYLEWDTEKFTEDVLLERLRRALGKSIFERSQESTQNSLSALTDTRL